MTIRKRDDAGGWKRGALGKYIEPSGVKPGDDWGDTSNIGANPTGHGKHTDDVTPVRNKAPFEATEESRDIWSDVEGQSGPNDRKIRSRGQS